MTKTIKTLVKSEVKVEAVSVKTEETVDVTKKKTVTAKIKKPSTVRKKASGEYQQQLPIEVIVQAMLDKKAQGVVSLDLTALGSAICDHFVVCNADSTTQVVAIADNVEKEMHERLQEKHVRAQGRENAFWIILDYTDVVVHIFQTEYRYFYRLEDLWADAVRKNYDT